MRARLYALYCHNGHCDIAYSGQRISCVLVAGSSERSSLGTVDVLLEKTFDAVIFESVACIEEQHRRTRGPVIVTAGDRGAPRLPV